MTGLVGRLGRPGVSDQKIIVSSLTNEALSVECAGTVAASAWSDRYAHDGRHIYTATVTVSGLSAFTRYPYTITQAGESISGAFRTLPADQNTDFGFILTTCDNRERNSTMDTFAQIQSRMQSAAEPIVAMLHIDDLNYVDQDENDDATTGLATSGAPEDTGLGRDFAVGYYAYLGGLPSNEKWRYPSRQWVYHNLPLVASPGDHGFERNHCRGAVGATDYAGCNRGAGATVPNLEENALAEWMAFVGNGQDDLYLAANKLHWGLEMGPCRFGLFDHQLTCEPYESGVTDDTLVCYGSTQIGELKTYLNVDSVPFKFACFESGFVTGQGQPWVDWHADEANAWATDWLAEADLNGTDGNLTILQGDNHRCWAFEGANWWIFCAGVVQDALSVYHQYQKHWTADPWGGDYHFLWQGYGTGNGDNDIGGFWHFRVLASESPRRIEAVFVDGRNGSEMSRTFELVDGAADNQWTIKDRARRIA